MEVYSRALGTSGLKKCRKMLIGLTRYNAIVYNTQLLLYLRHIILERNLSPELSSLKFNFGTIMGIVYA